VRHGRQDIHANDGDSAPRGVLARLGLRHSGAFVALGGTATAAALARDSVGAPQIKTDAVRSPEIKTDAVRSPEIQADAVRGRRSARTRTACVRRWQQENAEHHRRWQQANRDEKRAQDRRYRERKRQDPDGRERRRAQDRRYRERRRARLSDAPPDANDG
jgi:hypothetical protein